MRWIQRGVVLFVLAMLLCGAAVATGVDSVIKIEVNPSGRFKLEVLVVDEGDAPQGGVLVNLVDPDHPETPPINGSDGTYTTDEAGKITIALFPSNTQNYKIVVNHSGYERYESEVFQMKADTSKKVILKRTATPGTDYYYIYYHAGAGGTVGLERERVPEGGRPKKVPIPEPDVGYLFTGWYLDGKRVDEPEKLRIWRRTDLYARFERGPVVSPSPTPGETTAPVPTEMPPPGWTEGPSMPPNETPPPTQRPPVGPGQIDGGSGDAGGSGPQSPQPSGGGVPGTPPPVLPTDVPTVAPPHGGGTEEPPETHEVCQLQWLILVCAAVTAVLSALRLRYIRKELNEEETVKTDEEVPV